ncbi:CGNR zinc finger domain-containing protein [Leisingera sp. JC1]|uniref:CGNR zinc finger domain-containing protein n=1 Tax=Leisingera sp. JC1 TaxID=1855282 RepID=UPI0015860443
MNQTDVGVCIRTAICAEGIAREIGNQNSHRFGVCDAHHCNRVYFDTSRNGKRRYCSMQCQNRAKVAAFRQRNT